MMKALTLAACLALTACSTPPGPTKPPAIPDLPGAKGYALLDLPNQDDNVHHDTLLVYTTHALGDGRFIMAAKHVEDSREGLRLILYRPRPDSSAEVLAFSKPAYDSAVMLPTFFGTGDTEDGLIILANYGERESWGQNVFWLKDGQFHDLGWLDVVQRTWVEREGERQQQRNSIAPSTKISGVDGQFDFTFSADSVQLYDDLQGGIGVMLASPRVQYRFDGNGMVLYVDGEPRHQEPL
ncbi:MAG TPA: hypothetical protein PKD45_11585 [Flavobacteriales bacterium]|nr:hypothetical protein [Flavobacteriales bacterium]